MNAVLEGVKRGDGNVRVLLEYQGVGRTMFTFPLVDACPALVEAGVLKDLDCDSESGLLIDPSSPTRGTAS